MKGLRPVQARGWITSADCEGLPSLPVARACPSPRLRTGVPGDRMCAGGTATANSDPREDVRSGQLQHDVKKYIRGHESGDVVGISMRFFDFDHGAGHPRLLLCNAKASNS